MTRKTHTVQPLTDVPGAARALARAFRDNPGMRAILSAASSDQHREQLLVPVFDGFCRAVQRCGRVETVTIDGRVAGAQLTFGPGQYPPGASGTLALARGIVRTGAWHTARFAAASQLMERHHPKTPHHYLMVLGVDPEFQGQGVGGALLRALTARAEADGVDCYLETDKASSVGLYERHGYNVFWTEPFPRLSDDLQVWWMLRQPSAESPAEL